MGMYEVQRLGLRVRKGEREVRVEVFRLKVYKSDLGCRV